MTSKKYLGADSRYHFSKAEQVELDDHAARLSADHLNNHGLRPDDSPGDERPDERPKSKAKGKAQRPGTGRGPDKTARKKRGDRENKPPPKLKPRDMTHEEQLVSLARLEAQSKKGYASNPARDQAIDAQLRQDIAKINGTDKPETPADGGHRFFNVPTPGGGGSFPLVTTKVPGLW